VTAPWGSVFLVAAGAWMGVLAFGMGGIALLVRRAGIERAWPALRVWAPWLDLFGTWAGAIAVAALALGRRGIGAPWAAAVVCCALGVTAGLYGRAVLMPSLDAAFKRMRHAPDDGKWGSDWAFLWRMATAARALALVATAAAIACIAPLLW
jgi:hypothetical protein